MRTEKKKNGNLKHSALNTVFCVAHEMIENNGEDCYFYASEENRVILASFDGCGGSGAKSYRNYSGKTGAYVGSRAVCGGVQAWFEAAEALQKMQSYMERALQVCSQYEDKGSRLMGSMGKSFPTTAAVVYAEDKGGSVAATALWAGDSRCYMLDAEGLHQLSTDDLSGQDAFSNLTADGVMTNVISAKEKFSLHMHSVQVQMPCIFITATDGCFGYLSSPMAFEQLLLDSLVHAQSIGAWKKALNETIGAVAGDDYTLCVAVFGFKDFKSLRTHFAQRATYMIQRYADSLADLKTQWADYKPVYEKYLQ